MTSFVQEVGLDEGINASGIRRVLAHAELHLICPCHVGVELAVEHGVLEVVLDGSIW